MIVAHNEATNQDKSIELDAALGMAERASMSYP
jgi:hypothetical protein